MSIPTDLKRCISTLRAGRISTCAEQADEVTRISGKGDVSEMPINYGFDF